MFINVQQCLTIANLHFVDGKQLSQLFSELFLEQKIEKWIETLNLGEVALNLKSAKMKR